MGPSDKGCAETFSVWGGVFWPFDHLLLLEPALLQHGRLLTDFLSISNILGDVIVHVKFFHYHLYFSQIPTLFGGKRGMTATCRLEMSKVFQDFCRVWYISRNCFCLERSINV